MMARNMSVDGSMIQCKDTACLNGQMEKGMRASGKTTCSMGKAYSFGQMGNATEDSIRITRKVETVSCLGPMDDVLLELGAMEKI